MNLANLQAAARLAYARLKAARPITPTWSAVRPPPASPAA
jgi:hypothetical protein